MGANNQKFQGKYRIPSARAYWYDYREGLYFITICTKGMEKYFGLVIDAKVRLSAEGHIAANCWRELSDHFSCVKLHEFRIMPNHMHAILEILPMNESLPHDESFPPVQTLHATSVPSQKSKSEISPKKGSLAVVIRSYKSAVSCAIHQFDKAFAWQERFHDRIIRDAEEYHRIRQYIIDNPTKWEEDRYFSKDR